MDDVTDLKWLAGSWCGDLGPRRVDENWGVPASGAMEARVRITDEQGLTTVELIMIREGEQGLELLLRQFNPDLESINSQNLVLDSLEDRAVSFKAAPGAMIAGLGYSLKAENNLQVQVTLADGMVLGADLYRS